MTFTFTTQGTCARFIDIEIDDNQITSVNFIGGCGGNLQAVSRLLSGRPCTEAVELLRGIDCRNGTSCPDQLAQALEKHLLAEAS